VDVLAQPFAGDTDVGLVDVSLAAGDAATRDLSGGAITAWDPPMFVVDAPNRGAVQLTSNTTNITLMHVTVSPLPFAHPEAVAFLYGTADADGDGQLDDWSGDGQPDPYPEVLLTRIPQDTDGPEFKWPDGGAMTILLPAATVTPDPAGRNEVVGGFQAVNGLYIVVPPIAVVVEGTDATGKQRTRRLPALPVGQYAVTVIQATGQYWQVPNGLAPGGLFAANHGGPYTNQVARISVVAGR
jgi:hypothetical protein